LGEVDPIGFIRFVEETITDIEWKSKPELDQGGKGEIK
jgi:hypothetical protein